MSGPLNMSEASTGSSSLVEAKRARLQIEQDAQLLSNRIKLLQVEEVKTRRRIEETKRKTDLMLRVQDRKETERRDRERIQSERQRNTEAARKRFYSLKAQHHAEKLKQRELVWMVKKEQYSEGRAERDEAVKVKQTLETHLERENREKYRHVRGALKVGSERLSQRKTDITRESRLQYQQRIETEEKKKAALEHEVMSMEMLELELINKLKHTQLVEQEAMKQLEQVAKGKACLP